MAQREPVRSQLRLQGRAQRPRPDPRRSRRTIHLEHPPDVSKIDADRAAVALADIGLDAADDARAAAERNRGCTDVTAPLQHRRQLALVARTRHKIGAMRVITPKRTHQIAKRPPIRVRGPLIGIRAERGLERSRRRQTGGAQIKLLNPRRLLEADLPNTEALAEGFAQPLHLALAEALALEPTAPELPPPG